MPELLQIVWVPLESVHLNPNNPRYNEEAVEPVMRSIARFGFRVPIVVNRRTNVIEAGNTRWKAAKRMGLTEIPVIFADDDELTALAFALADNRTAEIATWDEPTLGELLKRLDVEGELSATGFTDDDLSGLLARLDAEEMRGREETFDPDQAMAEAERQQGPTRVRPREVWQLGKHRLLCGDATDPDNWERLMAGEVAHAIITDPPYAVHYVSGRGVDPNRTAGDVPERVDAYWDEMSPDEYAQLLERFLLLAHQHSDDRAPLYLWFASVNIRHVLASLDKAGWKERTLLVWVKNIHAGNLFAQYKYRMEPLYYAHKIGKAPRWHGPTNEVNVWEHDKPHVNDLHPTMKPVALIERAIMNATELGQLVIDPFLGSGTSIIAAERTGRRCYGLELDARYCDVIVNRWEEFTQQEAERIDG
ncbi:MAG: DNA modification methylase [Armatimonadota bacterium]|jgi:site-specific DNA-methyltransferase (adenine-specific)